MLQLTKLDDIFTLGKLILFIWTGLKPSHGSTALEPKEGDFCRVKKLVKIAGSTNFSSIGLDGKSEMRRTAIYFESHSFDKINLKL